MDEPFDFAFPSLTPSAAERIDQVCDRFEAAWQKGAEARIEDYVKGARELEIPTLLHQLLLLEFHYRALSGQSPSPAQYRVRFPEFSEVIDRALKEAHAPSASTDEEQGDADTVEFPVEEQALPGINRSGKLGKFELIEKLGAGGYGAVYRAKDPAWTAMSP